VTIRLNGTEHETSAGTISALLEELSLPPQTALVEHNGEPRTREEWKSAPLRDGDRVEVLRVAAGG
jgi:thiamine biosynthesis protein ThiS